MTLELLTHWPKNERGNKLLTSKTRHQCTTEMKVEGRDKTTVLTNCKKS